jgi:hypothetical protein
MTRFGQLTVLVLVVLAPTAAFQNSRRGRTQRNRPPTIQSFTSSMDSTAYCPFVPGGPCSTSAIATLEARASDPDGDELTYNYSVTAGAIAGHGATVNWDLFKTPFGVQTATVEVTDGRGGKTSSTAQVKVVVCGACDPPRPYLNLTCPSEVSQDTVAVFTLTVSGVGPDEKLTYLWSHANGKRLPGQVGPELKIQAVGSPGDVIKATVEVLGLDPSISRQASCETRIAKLPIMQKP